MGAVADGQTRALAAASLDGADGDGGAVGVVVAEEYHVALGQLVVTHPLSSSAPFVPARALQ